MRKRKLAKGERILYVMGFLSITMTIAIKIFLGASIGHYSLSVEIFNKKIANEQNQNESLVMQVDELTSFDNVKKIIDEMGLSYHNENIILINR